jgi:hypothetical protein
VIKLILVMSLIWGVIVFYAAKRVIGEENKEKNP